MDGGSNNFAQRSKFQIKNEDNDNILNEDILMGSLSSN